MEKPTCEICGRELERKSTKKKCCGNIECQVERRRKYQRAYVKNTRKIRLCSIKELQGRLMDKVKSYRWI
jgi:hypothetical protein